jgi:hypothetical protein
MHKIASENSNGNKFNYYNLRSGIYNLVAGEFSVDSGINGLVYWLFLFGKSFKSLFFFFLLFCFSRQWRNLLGASTFLTEGLLTKKLVNTVEV